METQAGHHREYGPRAAGPRRAGAPTRSRTRRLRCHFKGVSRTHRTKPVAVSLQRAWESTGPGLRQVPRSLHRMIHYDRMRSFISASPEWASCTESTFPCFNPGPLSCVMNDL